MKAIRSILLLTLIIVTAACGPKKDQESISLNVQETDKVMVFGQDWITLFDGTSMDAWRGYLMSDMPSEWSIEEGAMVFTPGAQGGKNIITKDQFTNFVLSLEWKISEGGNSGIFWGVHEDEKYSEAYQTGPEIQVLDDERHPDSFVGEGTHKSGSLFDMIAPSQNVVNPAGEWNLCEIEINRATNQGSVSLNGTQIVSFPVHGEGWNTMVANSKFKDWEGFGKYPTGHIALQDHGNKVWYRNIKIKNLD